MALPAAAVGAGGPGDAVPGVGPCQGAAALAGGAHSAHCSGAVFLQCQGAAAWPHPVHRPPPPGCGLLSRLPPGFPQDAASPLEPLRQLPHLEALSLRECSLKSLPPLPAGPRAQRLRRLEICGKDCAIPDASWLASLEELRCDWWQVGWRAVAGVRRALCRCFAAGRRGASGSCACEAKALRCLICAVTREWPSPSWASISLLWIACIQVPSLELCSSAHNLLLLTLATSATTRRKATSAEAAAAVACLRALLALSMVHFYACQVEWGDEGGPAAFVAALCDGKPELTVRCVGRPELAVGQSALSDWDFEANLSQGICTQLFDLSPAP